MGIFASRMRRLDACAALVAWALDVRKAAGVDRLRRFASVMKAAEPVRLRIKSAAMNCISC